MRKRKNPTFEELAAPMRNLSVLSRTNRYQEHSPFRGTVTQVERCMRHNQTCAGLELHIEWPDGSHSTICSDYLVRTIDGQYQIPK